MKCKYRDQTGYYNIEDGWSIFKINTEYSKSDCLEIRKLFLVFTINIPFWKVSNITKEEIKNYFSNFSINDVIYYDFHMNGEKLKNLDINFYFSKDRTIEIIDNGVTVFKKTLFPDSLLCGDNYPYFPIFTKTKNIQIY